VTRREHSFTCADCLTCVRCGMHMSAALETLERCAARGERHRHPHPQRESANQPYVPEWAIPLDRLTEL
jgi:rRNA maturation protein Nop10